VEPDLALNYDQLGDVYALMQRDRDAEKSYLDRCASIRAW
jgi:hypothetical protein